MDTDAQPDPAETMRRRLQADLRAAMKARAALEVAVLRRLIAAIDNAGAVPLPPRSEPIRSEVPRRRLDGGEVQTLLRLQQQMLQAAAEELAGLGRAREAERAALEAAMASRYLV